MQRKTLHLISQAHLDPVWLWPWRDGAAEALMTMQSAIDRMGETGDFKFSRSSAVTYEWVQQQDERLFEQIRRRVADGRWEVVNGWIEQPDCNIPSAESFIRHGLYGKGYFQRELGVDVAVGYNVDSFGHAAGLPQILASSGLRYYVFMRPDARQLELPTLFWWQSPDGSRVLAWRIAGSYCQSPSATPQQLEAAIRDASERAFPEGFQDGLFFLGVGNHGGGPTKAQIAKVQELRGDPSLPELRFSTLGEFFASIESSPNYARIPVVAKELQHVFTGCYSAMAEIKATNRRAERALVEAETMTTLAALALGRQLQPAGCFEAPWRKLLFNQFHDILAGTCTRSQYRDARDGLGHCCSLAGDQTVRAVHSIARRVDTSGCPKGVLFAANALPWPRKAVVQIDTFVSPEGKPISHLVAPGGRKLPVQWARADACFGPHLLPWAKLTAVVNLPAGGYSVLELGFDGPPTPAPKAKPSVSVKTDRRTLGIVSLKTADGAELLGGPVSFVAISDTSDTWGNGVYEYRRELGRPRLLSTDVIEDGPVVRIVRHKARWRSSDITLDVVTYAGIEAVELRVKVDWRQKHQILKLEVPTALKDVRCFAKVPGAVAERRPTGVEEPCQDFVALQGSTRKGLYSLGLVNDSTYSYDCLDGLLRTVIVRSAWFAQHRPAKPAKGQDYPCLDQGLTEKRFWLLAGKGPWTNLDLPRRAEELQAPVQYMMDSGHAGELRREASLLSLDGGSAVLTALKPAEDGSTGLRSEASGLRSGASGSKTSPPTSGKAIIVRIQETTGRPRVARLRIKPLNVDEHVRLRPWEIKTLSIAPTPAGAVVMETDLLERPVAGRQ